MATSQPFTLDQSRQNLCAFATGPQSESATSVFGLQGLALRTTLMPAYFFHLAFELCRGPTQGEEEHALDFWPAQNLDLFRAALPVHQASTWTSYLAPKKASSRLQAYSSSLEPRHHPSRSPSTTSAQTNLERNKTPKKKRLQEDQAARLGADTAHTDEAAEDWRFDAILVESIDMESNPSQGERSGNSSSENGPAPLDVALKGKYIPTNPRTTDLGWGVVHLYRDAKPTSSFGDAARDGPVGAIDENDAYLDNDCTTLCILAVPSYMTPSDFLGWIGEGTRDSVSHFRLVRTARSNRYMVLMKFRDAKIARQWQREYNGKLFNSMEPENCHVVFVKSIRFQTPETDRDPESFPDMTNDPFTPSEHNSAARPAQPASVATENSNRANAALTSKPAPPPTPALVELPTCPVCLERMDETTGLATIFCQHVFHCACLQKWRGSGCPVCRYTQNEHLYGSRAQDQKSAENECRVCGAESNLWICLICGHVGCGRYDEAHAFAHYGHTGHSFAMDIDTQHIWDYDGDEYVHRLIQNKADGKLVELPSIAPDIDGHGRDVLPRDKMENMSLEYTHLLTSQLDSQRLYFEEQIERAADKASEASAAAEQASEAAQKAAKQLAALQESHEQLARETLPALERDKERADRRAERFEALARKMEKEYREEKVINESLMDRIAHLEKQVGDATLKNSDLEEQNRDLSFFISGMEKLRDQGEDVQEGTLTVGDGPGKGKQKKGKPKR